MESAGDDVRLELFTTAFRKVMEKRLGSLPMGVQQASFDLKDNKGTPLASGIYYLVISSGSHRSVGKLLLLR